MTRQVRSSLLWGLVGTLSFLVLFQGYRLVVGPLRASVLVLGVVAVLVGLASAGLAHVVEPRMRANGRT